MEQARPVICQPSAHPLPLPYVPPLAPPPAIPVCPLLPPILGQAACFPSSLPAPQSMPHLLVLPTLSTPLPTPAVDGLEHDRMPLEQQVHFLLVETVLPEVVGEHRRSTWQVCDKILFQQHLHGSGDVVRGLALSIPATGMNGGYECRAFQVSHLSVCGAPQQRHRTLN